MIAGRFNLLTGLEIEYVILDTSTNLREFVYMWHFLVPDVPTLLLLLCFQLGGK